MNIIDLTKDHTDYIRQGAEILSLAFAEHWTDAWAEIEDGIEELETMTSGENFCRIALIESRVVGLIGGIPEYDGNVWELHPLAIHPDFQGQGIGRALVEDFERIVADKGGLTIQLGSDDEDNMTSLSNIDLYDNLPDKIANIQNVKNHPYSFYQKLGYTIIGVVPDANGIGKPDILMGKRVAKNFPHTRSDNRNPES